MTALRTTRPDTDPRPARFTGHGIAFALAVVLGFGLLAGMTGCSRAARDGADPDPYRPKMTQLPPPASDRIDYSAKDGKLTFYDPPGGPARWMIRRPGVPTAYPVGPEHTLPAGTDPEETFVYYVRPGGAASREITLSQIRAARPAHDSQIR